MLRLTQNTKVEALRRAPLFEGLSKKELIELAETGIEGIAVLLGARISALAEANEVLVFSSTVEDLVAGSGIEFADRGIHELKGVPGEWHVDLVTAAG